MSAKQLIKVLDNKEETMNSDKKDNNEDNNDMK